MQVECDRIVTYVGPSGMASRYPLRAGQDAPDSLTMASGEVRVKTVVAYVEPMRVEDAFPVVDMAVAS